MCLHTLSSVSLIAPCVHSVSVCVCECVCVCV